jgi:hypothetical protein
MLQRETGGPGAVSRTSGKRARMASEWQVCVAVGWPRFFPRTVSRRGERVFGFPGQSPAGRGFAFLPECRRRNGTPAVGKNFSCGNGF